MYNAATPLTIRYLTFEELHRLVATALPKHAVSIRYGRTPRLRIAVHAFTQCEIAFRATRGPAKEQDTFELEDISFLHVDKWMPILYLPFGAIFGMLPSLYLSIVNERFVVTKIGFGISLLVIFGIRMAILEYTKERLEPRIVKILEDIVAMRPDMATAKA